MTGGSGKGEETSGIVTVTSKMYSRFQYIHIKLLILVAIVSLAASKYAYEGFIGSKHKPYEVGSSSSRLSKIDLTASNFNFPLPTYENAPTTGSSNRIPDSKYQHRTITDFQTRSSRLGSFSCYIL